MNDTFFVNPHFKDPVKAPKLAKIDSNPFYGYYGYPRNNGQKEHFGFDYDVQEGTEVFAVEKGEIVQIRIGKYANGAPYSCKQAKDWLNASDKTEFFFDAQHCTNCCNGCFGVQVWMAFSNSSLNGKYAYYAHLSKLNGTVLKNMSFVKKDAITYLPKMKTIIESGDKIGESGRTGNASEQDNEKKYKWPPHLHFECREGNGMTIPETGTQIIPNHILNTNFTIMRVIDNLSFGVNVWSPLEEATQNEWIAFFNQKQREESYNLTSQTDPIRFKIVGDDSFNNSSLAYIRQ